MPITGNYQGILSNRYKRYFIYHYRHFIPIRRLAVASSHSASYQQNMANPLKQEDEAIQMSTFVSTFTSSSALPSSPSSVLVDPSRVRVCCDNDEIADVRSMDPSSIHKGGILYWMQREQRVQDNWALLYANQLAHQHHLPLYVCFCLLPSFLEATERAYQFMIGGMKELETAFRCVSVPFYVLLGYSYDVIPAFVQQYNIAAVVNDFNPLRCHREWVKKTAEILRNMNVPVYRVDAHNVVPMWMASNKLEYAARTIRPKINKLLPHYLKEFPTFQPPQIDIKLPPPIDWTAVNDSLQIDRSVKVPSWIQPGEEAARNELQSFLSHRIKYYHLKRNDPNQQVLSNMSCYLHYGQISAARIVLECQPYKSRYSEAVAKFIEEVVIRRELADNFCWYQARYDSFAAAPQWAQESLNQHRSDPREFHYTRRELEFGVTYDDLWNAAELQLVKEGKMHGWLRMYWAKKLLEWSQTPEEALAICIYLNDKYSLDGRDPNGYVGIAWSILGVHDQGWKDRPIFGKIRYMNYAGCVRKFDVQAFVAKFPEASPGSRGFKENQRRARTEIREEQGEAKNVEEEKEGKEEKEEKYFESLSAKRENEDEEEEKETGSNSSASSSHSSVKSEPFPVFQRAKRMKREGDR